MIVDAFLVYQMSKRLLLPFHEWDAYHTNVIDSDGNILIPKEQRTYQQNQSFQLFDKMILNIKKLLDKIPGGQSTIARILSVVYLLHENITDPDQINEEDLLKYINEDAPVNNVGEGNIAGVGVGPQGKPAVNMLIHRKKRKELLNKAKNTLDLKNFRKVIDGVNI